MAGTKEGAAKRLQTEREKYGHKFLSKRAQKAGKRTKGGFASEKVGKDGLTGRERASKYGSKGGSVSPTNFKNDPERAKQLSHEYWDKKGAPRENNDVSS